MINPLHIIKGARVTEKSTILTSILNQYTFEVDRLARAQEIADAVEIAFNVKVARVNTLNRPGKIKRNRRHGGMSRCDHLKKAIVTLKDGYKIEFA